MLAIAAYIVFVIWFIGTAGGSSGIWDEFEQGFEEGWRTARGRRDRLGHG